MKNENQFFPLWNSELKRAPGRAAPAPPSRVGFRRVPNTPNKTRSMRKLVSNSRAVRGASNYGGRALRGASNYGGRAATGASKYGRMALGGASKYGRIAATGASTYGGRARNKIMPYVHTAQRRILNRFKGASRKKNGFNRVQWSYNTPEGFNLPPHFTNRSLNNAFSGTANNFNTSYPTYSIPRTRTPTRKNERVNFTTPPAGFIR